MVRPTPVFQEIKQQLMESNETQRVTRDEIIRLRETFASSIEQSKMANLKGLETQRESKTKLSGTAGQIGGAMSSAGGGIMGFLGKLLGGMPMVFMAGAIGAIAVAITTFLKLDFKKFKENMIELLSISDDLGGYLATFAKGGTFFAIMAGIGFGLAAVGIGTAIGAAGVSLAEWLIPNYYTVVKENVKELLSIATLVDDSMVETLKSGGTFFVVMAGLSAGLAAFGIGSAIGGAGTGLAAWLNGDDWAARIKNSVAELLSINDLVGTGDYAAFSESGTFITIMGGISAGLVAFAGGSAFAGIVDYFTGEGSIPSIVNNVKLLLGIASSMGKDPRQMYEESTFLYGSMQKIGDALSYFAGSDFVGSLKSAGASIINFLSGNESPMAAIVSLSEKSDDLQKTGTALDSIAGALQKISLFNFAGGGVGLHQMAKDLMYAMPIIETIIKGGTLPDGIFVGTKVKGLASPEIPYDEALENMNKLRATLGAQIIELPKSDATVSLGAGTKSGAKLGQEFNNINTLSNAPPSQPMIIDGSNNTTNNIGQSNTTLSAPPTSPGNADDYSSAIMSRGWIGG